MLLLLLVALQQASATPQLNTPQACQHQFQASVNHAPSVCDAFVQLGHCLQRAVEGGIRAFL